MILKSLILVASEDTKMTEKRRGRPNAGVGGIKDAGGLAFQNLTVSLGYCGRAQLLGKGLMEIRPHVQARVPNPW